MPYVLLDSFLLFGGSYCFRFQPHRGWGNRLEGKGKGHPITGHQGPRGGVEV
jgi:hypothetical protein